MSWYSVLGVVGVLAAAALAVWYKVKQVSSLEASADLQEQARVQMAQEQQAATAQIAAKNDEQRKVLNDAIIEARKITDDEVRRHALLDILAKQRGVR